MQQSHKRLFLAVIAIIGLLLFGFIYFASQKSPEAGPALHIDSAR